MQKLLTMAGLFALALGLSACNTMKGMGKDIERGGEKIQGTATETQKDMSKSGTSSGASSSGTSSDDQSKSKDYSN